MMTAPSDNLTAADMPVLLTGPMVLRYFVPVNRRTLLNWIKAGMFPPADFRLNRNRYWRRRTIERWIAQQQGQGGR
jgi:predicted DNA-binding transcriptional regulator AlpA